VHEQNWEETLNYTTEIEKLNSAAFPLSRMYNAAANFNLGKLDAAEASAKQFLSFDQDHHYPEAMLLMCNILTGKGDYAGAATVLQNYLDLVPKAPNLPELKARLKELKDNQVSSGH
jgi:TolA-binding protein